MHLVQVPREYPRKRAMLIAGFAASILVILAVAFLPPRTFNENQPVTGRESLSASSPRRLQAASRRIPVFSAAQDDDPIARKQRHDLEQSLSSDTVVLEPIVLNLEEQRKFVRSSACGDAALERFDKLVSRKQEHLAVELWKYCALWTRGSADRAVYVDSSSPFLLRLQELLSRTENFAVLGDSYFPRSIHGSLLVLGKDQLSLAQNMVKTLVDTSLDVLEIHPLLLPRTLYSLISAETADPLSPGQNGDSWFLLEQKCHVNPLRRSEDAGSGSMGWTNANSYRSNHHCPEASGFCCTVIDGLSNQAVLMSRHPVLPFQKLPDDFTKPYNAEAGHYEEEELPFISIIREKVFPHPKESKSTPNFFDVLLANDCLPSSDDCNKCLHKKTGADCKTCEKECSCYCKTLCHEKVDSKRIAKELTIAPPLYSRDPNRLVPRIVHQTYFEELTRERYPNMSRLVESFKRSGWEYRFYSDEEAASFLSTHFPSEVREAYDALNPGAFKADLFRYCVLLIHGGVYADVDIMLESSLDLSVAPDVGFMVPVDEPGEPVGRRMCLWNGFIAAAPGHPFLAKAIETVVNQVRNRFTSVDVDATFCPDPELSVLHAFDTLFSAGPCLLGASINRVLGKHGQTHFEAGDIHPKEETGKTEYLQPELPGRSIILHQNKWDMGAHRFTLLDQNLVVSATDLPDSNDRDQVKESGEHYSKTHAKTGIYGLHNLYKDSQRANEDIRIRVDSSHQAKFNDIM